jgi:ATPase subunit of ABC transporter with duplicated ATPase domains
MNNVATDIINMRDSKLTYYPGCNYCDYVNRRREGIDNQVCQSGVLEKQRSAMMASIDIMKKKSHQADSGMTKKKIDSAIKSKEKKLERHGVEKVDKGNRRVSQTDGGIRKGSINSVGASLRNTLTHRELLKLAEINFGPVPDKAVQFDFANVSSTWGDEPLCMVMDMGHGYNDDGGSSLIFDCVDLAIREGSRMTILGENGLGKSSLLSIIAGTVTPSVGKVHFVNGISIGHFHQHAVDNLFSNIGGDGSSIVTPRKFDP